MKEEHTCIICGEGIVEAKPGVTEKSWFGTCDNDKCAGYLNPREVSCEYGAQFPIDVWAAACGVTMGAMGEHVPDLTKVIKTIWGLRELSGPMVSMQVEFLNDLNYHVYFGPWVTTLDTLEGAVATLEDIGVLLTTSNWRVSDV